LTGADTLVELGSGTSEKTRLLRYLDDPPTVDELDAVLRRLRLDPWDIARMNEPLADELDLAHLPRDRRRWLDVMVANRF
jgi:arsenate reductase